MTRYQGDYPPFDNGGNGFADRSGQFGGQYNSQPNGQPDGRFYNQQNGRNTTYQAPNQPVPNQPVPIPSQQQYVPAGGVRPVTQFSAAGYTDNQTEKSTRPGGFWSVLFFLALLVLIGAISAVGYIVYTYINGQNQYDELTQYMTVDDSDGVLTLGSFDVDWDALRAINEDVVGWIYIPDTIINYPIVWRENDDEYYLKHNFGDNSVGDFGAEYGCLMLAGVNSPEWTDQVNIIYGHNMRNGSMFAELAKNTDEDIFNSHRVVYVLTPVGNFKLTTFACDKVIGSSTDIVIPNFNTKEGFEAYVQARIDESLVTPKPAAPSASKIEQVFALSTCNEPDNNYRIITFCTVDEFLPAGSDVSEGNSLVDAQDVQNVGEGTGERLK